MKNSRTYLTDDARQQEAACQRPGDWLVEGYRIFRHRRWGYADYWSIFDGDAPLDTPYFASLAEARNWLADYLSGASRFDGEA